MKRLSALCLVLIGCASMSGESDFEKFQKTAEAYLHAYKWKNYDRAAQFLPADIRMGFLAAHEDAELQIEDYKVVNVDMIGGDSAKVQVRFTYMRLPAVTVEKKTAVQHWHKLDGAWILENEDNSIVTYDQTPQAPPAAAEDPRTDVEMVAPGEGSDDEPPPFSSD